MFVDWSLLPSELLEVTYKRLRSAGDIIRFGAVCTSWNTVAGEAKKPPLSPMLLLSPNEHNPTHRLFDFSINKFLKFEFSEMIEGEWCSECWWCSSSCNGWLLTINFNSPHEMSLLNPFAGIRVQLPPASTFEDPHSEELDSFIPTQLFITKAVTSSSPLDPNCIVMVIHSMWHKLAFCRPCDEKWRTLESGIYHYQDVIFYENEFYATARQEVGIVQCDIGPQPKVTLFAPPVSIGSLEEKYLVESCGDFLQVSRFRPWTDEDYETTTRILVHKLNFETKRWEEVKSLGDNAIFIGLERSILISTKDFVEFKGDCIYFVDDYLEGYLFAERGCYDKGVFNLKTRTVQPFFQSSEVFKFPSLWITPTLL